MRQALAALPGYFESVTSIEGVEAGDLFSLNQLLGATIEVQVVNTLNKMRSVWDPNDELENFFFQRQAQTFPDVRLVNTTAGSPVPILGIELKGWYLLSKEHEPSLRYKTTPTACADIDLIAVFPWHLSNVLAGTPVVLSPWVESAKYAADAKNHWWQHVRESSLDKGIKSPEASPYPVGRAEVRDKPHRDSGNNFGRLARVTGLMPEFVAENCEHRVAGIPAASWITFFKLVAESSSTAKLKGQLVKHLTATDNPEVAARVENIAALIETLLEPTD